MFGISAFSQAPFSSLGQNVFDADVSEAVNASDSSSTIGTFFVAINEQLNAADTFDGLRFTYAFISDSISVSDIRVFHVIYDGQIDEDVQFDASNQGDQIAGATTIEQISISGVFDGQGAGLANISETILAEAAVSSQGNFISFIAAHADLSAVNLGSVPYFPAIVETIDAYDLNISSRTTIHVVEDRLELSSTVDRFRGALVDSAESITVDNTQSVQADFVGSISETVRASVALALQSVLNVDIDEDAQFNAINIGANITAAQLFETVLISSEWDARVPVVVTVNDTVRVSDVPSATRDLVVFIVEGVRGSSASSVIGNFLVTVAESAQLLDAPVGKADYLVYITEQIALSDSILYRLLWIPVLDGQVPNWQNVASSTSPGWNVFETETESNWTQITRNN